MDNQNLGLLLTQSGDVTLLGCFFNIALAAASATILARVYVRCGRALSNRRAFSHIFLLLVLTTMLVISIVKSSLALSLGLIGALSIVRFRAAIKEPEELAYLFVAIALGLGFGANQRLITLAAFAAILLILLVREKFTRSEYRWEQGSFLSVRCENNLESTSLDQIIRIIKSKTDSFQIKRVDFESAHLDAVFIVNFKDMSTFASVQKDMRQIDPGVTVSFLDNSSIALEAGSP